MTPKAIREAIEKLGYSAELVETKKSGATPQSSGLLAKFRARC